MFGFKPLLGLEPMAPIRPQLLVSHANHSATETSMYVCMYVCIYVCMTTYMYCLYVGVEYTYIDVNALAQGIKSLLVSQVWLYVCMYVFMYACMCGWMSMYVCTYVRAYVHPNQM